MSFADDSQYKELLTKLADPKTQPLTVEEHRNFIENTQFRSDKNPTEPNTITLLQKIMGKSQGTIAAQEMNIQDLIETIGREIDDYSTAYFDAFYQELQKHTLTDEQQQSIDKCITFKTSIGDTS